MNDVLNFTFYHEQVFVPHSFVSLDFLCLAMFFMVWRAEGVQ